MGFYLSLRASVLLCSAGSITARAEYIIAEILFKDRSKLLLAVVYRPPNSGYINEFFQAFLDLQLNYQHSVIMGDFNADMAQLSFDSRQLSSFVSGACLHLVPFAATHHTRNSSTILDLCILDDEDKLVEFGQWDVAFLSAHDLIYIY